MRERIQRCCLQLLLLAPLLAGPALAEPTRSQAEQLLKEGNACADRGDFEGALKRYGRARVLFPSYKLGFNIGIALEGLGRAAEAALEFDTFLRHSPEAAMARAARQHLASLKQRIVSVHLTCTLEGRVLVDDREVARTPLEGSLYLEPGEHRLVVERVGHPPFVERISRVAGDEVSLQVPAVPPAREPVTTNPSDPERREPSHAPRPFYKRWWFWTVVGAVVIGGTVGGVVAGVSGGSHRVPRGELGVIDLRPAGP